MNKTICYLVQRRFYKHSITDHCRSPGVWQQGQETKRPTRHLKIQQFPTSFDLCTYAKHHQRCKGQRSDRTVTGGKCSPATPAVQCFVAQWQHSWQTISIPSASLTRHKQIRPDTNKFDASALGTSHQLLRRHNCHSEGDEHIHSMVVIQPVGHLVLHRFLLLRRRKSFGPLFSRGERKVGFPFSNFHLTSCTVAAVCWSVNLPITAL